MDTTQKTPNMNLYISALADVKRLQILARLIEAPCTGEQLCAATGLQPEEINRHLDLLSGLELVESRLEQGVQVYAYRANAMDNMIKARIARQKPAVETPWDGMPEDARRRTVSLAAKDGRLEYIPTQPKKLLPILEYVSGSFEKGREYSEKEVNAFLEKYTKDTSTLRRFLVDHGYLVRTPDGARYWTK